MGGATLSAFVPNARRLSGSKKSRSISLSRIGVQGTERSKALGVCSKRLPLIKIEELLLHFATRIGVGAPDRNNLEPEHRVADRPAEFEIDHTLDSKVLSKTFAEMESWSEELRGNDEVLKALRSISDGKDCNGESFKRQGPQLRGPSR